MGNTLTTQTGDARINNSLLGKEIKKILTNKQEVIDVDKNGKDIIVPINKYRACCLKVLKNEKDLKVNDFITVKLPVSLPADDPRCNGKPCMGSQNLGLQISGDPTYCTKQDLFPGQGGRCDAFMVNSCAKHLYDRGCIECIKKNPSDKECVPQWNSKNPNCFSTDPNNPSLVYGPEECACINSSTGFSLNMNPSNQIKGGVEFKNKFSNPYGVPGNRNNLFTKYSLNLFNYPEPQQYPQVLDQTCAATINGGSLASGRSAAYKLPRYETKGVNICLNQINIGNSNIGTANLKNIQQNNNCGNPSLAGKKPPIQKSPAQIKKEKEAAAKKKAEELAAKKKAEEAAAAIAKEKAEEAAAKKKAEEEAAAAAKKKAEESTAAKEKAEEAAAAKEKAGEEAAKKKDDIKKIAEDKSEPVLEEEISIQSDEEYIEDDKKKYLIYGGVGLLAIIVILVLLLLLKK